MNNLLRALSLSLILACLPQMAIAQELPRHEPATKTVQGEVKEFQVTLAISHYGANVVVAELEFQAKQEYSPKDKGDYVAVFEKASSKEIGRELVTARTARGNLNVFIENLSLRPDAKYRVSYFQGNSDTPVVSKTFSTSVR